MNYSEGRDSYILYNKGSITVDELLFKVRGKRPRPFNALWLRDNALGTTLRYDQKRVDAVDINVPIIVLVEPEPNLNNVILVLDGAHRIIRATQEGYSHIEAYCLTETELSARLSDELQHELDVLHGWVTAPERKGLPVRPPCQESRIGTMAETRKAPLIKP